MHFTCWAFLPSGPEWLYIGVLFVLLFGADKLPQFARTVGRVLGEFKRAKEEMEEELRRATDEDNRPRLRPRAEDDEAMPHSPKTLPVTESTTQAALPAPTPEQIELENLPQGAPGPGHMEAETSHVPSLASALPATAPAVATAVAAAALVPVSTTPVLRPVTTAVPFGSARRPVAPTPALTTSAPPSVDDDFDMPTTQIDDSGQPVSPVATYDDEVPATATLPLSEEAEALRRPSSFVM